MAPLSNLFAFLALTSLEVMATPTAAGLGDLLSIVSLDLAPLVTKVVTTTYPATTPTTYTSSTYDTGCQCYYSTVYWWTPDPYPSTTSAPTSPSPTDPATITETVTVPTTTTVTTTATVTTPCTPTLSCDKYGYLIQNVTLFRVDLATGDFVTVADHLGDDTSINAIAYNTLDDFLYARQGGQNQLIRIASDGTTEAVATFPAGTSSNTGDIDTDGYYWYGASGTTWNQLDLRPGSATYGTVLASGTADTLGLGIADWAYLPVAGPYLYTAARSPASIGGTTLARFSLETKTWEVIERYPRIGGNAWGAVYAINNGTLYASDNANGQIWAFPIAGGSPYLASQGPVSPGLNDGARCVLNLDLD
ncbi:putative proline rich protein 5 protein [Rosellinia necatrix]|uniref:Putative proline rich protein 5 protein n=1 Tax=Rosellinia necatrix TaxID=77044 RepID=A0A1S7UHX0_ROSNE|nr:putative proline rich protein 5 protein [Rosellinia necatrix]